MALKKQEKNKLLELIKQQNKNIHIWTNSEIQKLLECKYILKASPKEIHLAKIFPSITYEKIRNKYNLLQQ